MRTRLRTIVVAISATLCACGSLIVTPKSAEYLESRSGFDWSVHDSGEFTVYAESSSRLVEQSPKIAASAQAARAEVCSELEIPDDGQTEYRVFVVDSRERMKDLIGRRTNATGFHASRVVCLVWDRTGTAGLRHELAHVIAMNAWGVPERWVNEGVAVDVTGRWIGLELNTVCHILHDQGDLPTLDQLTRQFNRIPSAVSYPAAGSFIRFLRETYGLDAVRNVWRSGRDGVTKATGDSWDELESSWLSRIQEAPTSGAAYDPKAITPSDDQ